MRELETAGLIVMHVHDEVICDQPLGQRARRKNRSWDDSMIGRLLVQQETIKYCIKLLAVSHREIMSCFGQYHRLATGIFTKHMKKYFHILLFLAATYSQHR